MFERTLQANPNAIGISAIKPLIHYVYVSKYDFLMYKNMIEIFIAIICLFCVFAAEVAMIFPIIYFQYIRIKFISSIYTRRVFSLLDKNVLEAYLPSAIYSSSGFTWIKLKLANFVDFEKNNTKKSEQVTSQSFRGDDQKADSQAEYIKSFQQGSQGSQKKSKKGNGQASARVHMGPSAANQMGEEQ